jgi:uncharacterized protein (TIGR03086 family)
MDILEQLDQAAAALTTVARGVKEDQLSRPTPCSEWDVQALMNHAIGSFAYFQASATGVKPAESQPAQPAGLNETVEQLTQAAAAVATAWKTPGALERKSQSPMGELPGSFMANISLTEMVVHGWDLARATGQKLPVSNEIAQSMLQAAHANLKPEMRQTAFGPEQQAAAGAPALDQLAAFMGRAV